jgi:hypothetical protein
MKLKTLVAVSAAALVVPFTVQAGNGDSMLLAQAGGPGPKGPVDSRKLPSEASPNRPMAAPTFAQIDKNNDSNISRSEWDAYYHSSASAGASVNAQTGTTAGPGSTSARTGDGAATATTPSTSGHGKPR